MSTKKEQVEQLTNYMAHFVAHIGKKLPDDIKASKHVETGNIPKAIMRVAAEEHSDLIIMGSRGLGVVKGVLRGSVSQYIVEQSKCPVLVVK